MPRMKPPGEKLDDSINVPVPRRFKRRVVTLAKRQPGQPKLTRYVRGLLEVAVAQAEKQPA